MKCDVFISYSRADITTVEVLERALQAERLVTWRDVREVRGGHNFTEAIAAALDSCYAVVWLASVASVRSEWVQRELAYATETKKLIVPVLLSREALDLMPPGLRLLFTHINYVSLEGQDWRQGLADLVRTLREACARAELLAPAEPPAPDLTPSPAAGAWPDETGAVETPAGLDLLPIEEETPLVLGVAVDVSGTMQTAIRNDSGGEQNRLQGVLDAIRDLAGRYREASESPEVEESLAAVKLFAYGFGFAERAAKFGKLPILARRIVKDLPPVPSRVFRGAVRDLLEIAGFEPRAVSPKEIDEQWPVIEERLWEQRIDLFGTTPMRAALEVVSGRFGREFAAFDGLPHSALILLSDGESKDGSPLEACRNIARRGTVILSCYLTGEDVAEPRRLYARPQPGWPEGAVTLFRCSSVLEEDSLLLPVLREKGWVAGEGDRLFVQLNQSALVAEFVSLILDVGSGRKTA